jgi:hypothetical protein
MRRMRFFLPFSPGTVSIVLRIILLCGSTIEDCNPRVSTPGGISAITALISNSGTDTRPNADVNERPRKDSASTSRDIARPIF